MFFSLPWSLISFSWFCLVYNIYAGQNSRWNGKIVRLMHLAHLAEICSAKNLCKLQCEDKLQSERINPGKGNDPSWCVLHFHLSSTYLRFLGREYCIRFEQIWFWCRKKVEINYFKANIFNLDKKNRFEETCLVCCRYDKKYIERQYHLKGDTCLSGKSCHATQIGKMLLLRKEIFSGSFLLEQANIEILLSLNNLFGGLLN